MSVSAEGWMTPPYAVLYALGAVSFTCSCYVVYCILKFSALKVVITRLILYVHITLLLENIVSMPFAFNENVGLCQVMGFLWTYIALSRVFVVACMVVIYRNVIFEDSLWSIKEVICRWGEIIVFVLPAVPAITPFITDSFGSGGNPWCAIIHGPQADVMAFVSLYGWAWFLLLATVFILLWTVIEVYRVDSEMTSKVVSTVGLYVVVAIASWIPRTEARLYRLVINTHYTGFYVDTIVLYVSGLIYFAIFLSERKGISRFDHFSQSFAFRLSNDIQSTTDGEGSSPRFAIRITDDLLEEEEDVTSERSRSYENLLQISRLAEKPLVATIGIRKHQSCSSDSSSSGFDSAGEKTLLESLLKLDSV